MEQGTSNVAQRVPSWNGPLGKAVGAIFGATVLLLLVADFAPWLFDLVKWGTLGFVAVAAGFLLFTHLQGHEWATYLNSVEQRFPAFKEFQNRFEFAEYLAVIPLVLIFCRPPVWALLASWWLVLILHAFSGRVRTRVLRPVFPDHDLSPRAVMQHAFNIVFAVGVTAATSFIVWGIVYVWEVIKRPTVQAFHLAPPAFDWSLFLMWAAVIGMVIYVDRTAGIAPRWWSALKLAQKNGHDLETDRLRFSPHHVMASSLFHAASTALLIVGKNVLFPVDVVVEMAEKQISKQLAAQQKPKIHDDEIISARQHHHDDDEIVG